MTILQSSIVPSTGGYQISRSLRFNSADSAYLNRTPASAGNRRTWTWSGWTKIDASSAYRLFAARVDDNNRFIFAYAGSTQFNLQVSNVVSGTSTVWAATNALLRDPSAWYHFVVTFDSTQATATNRLKVYVNGVEQTFSTDNRSSITQNYDGYVNNSIAHYIGTATTAAGNFSNGYMTEVNFIDGQALTPSSFGQSDPNTGVWSPIRYTGTYGTNGFYLNFSDNSNTTSTTLGKDYSGNGNNWTPNNFSVTAGAGNDSLVDTPTSYGTDTGVGGEVRGNYATLNSVLVAGGYTLANGNLEFTRTGATGGVNDRSQFGTIGVTSGKWYWEFTAGTVNSNSIPGFGIAIGSASTQSWGGGQTGVYIYQSDGLKYLSGTGSSYGAAFTTGDIIGVAFDADAGTLTFYKNNVSQGQAASGLTSGPYFPAVTRAVGGGGSNGTEIANFGQRPFAYTAPSGFKALCTQNLPTPTIGATSTTQAGKYMNAVLYTGNGSTQSITGVGFQPDFVWIKNRGTATDHGLFDAIRGTTKRLSSNLTNAETTEVNSLTAFNSDGFSVGATQDFNQNTVGIVAWNWNAGGSNATNTSGTITSTVRANTTAGFSIVTYTGTGANATVGHGLGVAPSMVIVKSRSVAGRGWIVWHSSLAATEALELNVTDAKITSTTSWNSTAPSSTVISLGTRLGTNESGTTFVCYAFAAVAGYSAFGSYTGNGSTDGPFVYTGFRPRWILTKAASGATGSWWLYDTARSTFNEMTDLLRPDLSNADTTQGFCDALSNGFKIRNSGNNTNTATYIYAAFAESPFKYSLAR